VCCNLSNPQRDGLETAVILNHIKISQFRNLVDTQLSPSSVNVLAGKNGSGKTSVLEAIYYLGHGRSFRTVYGHHLINHQHDRFNLWAQIQDHERSCPLGVEKSKQEHKIKYDGESVRNSSVLARLLPIQVINPDVHRLLEDTPRYRRKFLDWGVFHVEHSYGTLWKRFHALLKQRNAALKKRWDYSLVKHWDAELIQVVSQIDDIKKAYSIRLEEIFKQYAQLFHVPVPNMAYYSGWPKDQTYEESLHQSWDQDLDSGFTRLGPHRSDLILKLGSYRAKDVVSRGQQKVIAILLKLAQVKLFVQSENRPIVLLMDDLASELDQTFTHAIIELLQTTHCQLFVTATETDKLEPLLCLPGSTMFHVEHGLVKEVV